MTRSGSFLLIAIALSASLIAIAFAFLRVTSIEADASLAARREHLARLAAQQGVHRAIEVAVRDLSLPVQVPTASGTVAIDATTLDGAWRAAFRSFAAVDRNRESDRDDVREEDLRTDALLDSGLTYNYRTEPYARGWTHDDGRGRWIEPEFDAADPLTPGPRFTQVTGMGTPSRAHPLLVDAELRPLPSGLDVAEARRQARYRLRYAVGMMDLHGQLLANPWPEYDYRQHWRLERVSGIQATTSAPDGSTVAYPDPTAEAGLGRSELRAQVVRRHAPAFAAMVAAAHGGASCDAGIAAERALQVFLGHGVAGNVARNPADGFPVTHSFMFRAAGIAGGGYLCTPLSFALGTVGTTHGGGRAQALYRPGQDQAGVVADPLGGQHLARLPATAYIGAISHSMVGMPMSFAQQQAMQSALQARDGGVSALVCQFLLTPFGRSLATPATAPLAAGEPGWPAFQAQVQAHVSTKADTPWYVNLCTATPATLRAMLGGFLPPYLKTVEYDRIEFRRYAGKDANGRDQWVSETADPAQWRKLVKPQYAGFGGRDLFVPSVSRAFVRWREPVARDAAQVPAKAVDGTNAAFAIAPGGWVCPGAPGADPRLAHPAQAGHDPAAYRPDDLYPGKAITGRYGAADADEGEDDAGELIPMNRWAWGVDPESGAKLFPELGSEAERERGDGDPPAALPGGSNGKVLPDWWANDAASAGDSRRNQWIVQLSDQKLKYLHSYWFDLAWATTTAVSLTRAQLKISDAGWARRGAVAIQGGNDPAAYDSVAELDAAMLGQLGEDPVAPGAAVPAPGTARVAEVLGGLVTYTAKTVPHNLFSLAPPPTGQARGWDVVHGCWLLAARHPLYGVGGAQRASAQALAYARARAQAMELMLNDWRLSFFGASPQYTAFRPGDFDGDGVAWCSAYAGGQRPANLGWGPQPQTAAGDRWFCLTGTFFVGRSRCFRAIVRGELYDAFLDKAVARTALDSVFVVDPDRNPGLSDTHVIYQRWLYHKLRTGLPNPYP